MKTLFTKDNFDNRDGSEVDSQNTASAKVSL